MKNIITLILSTFIFTSSFAYVVDHNPPVNDTDPTIQELKDGLENLTIDDILTLTPKKYKEITGKRMGFKNAVKLKIVKKKLKKYG